MDYTDVTYEIDKIQSSIRDLQNLIKRSYDGKFTNGKQIICDVLSDAFDDIGGAYYDYKGNKANFRINTGRICFKI